MTEGPTVLVVDDEDALRELAVDVLTLAGYQAVALTVEPALVWLETAWPACMVVDLGMPVLDGVAFVEAVLAAHGRVPPVIFITAYARPGHTSGITARAEALGAVAVLTKPIPNETFVAAVAGAIAAEGLTAPLAPPVPDTLKATIIAETIAQATQAVANAAADVAAGYQDAAP